MCLYIFVGGHVFSWGANMFGQLGLGNKSYSVNAPERVLSLTGLPLYKIAAGGYHSVALTFSGGVFAWGRNE